MTEIHLMQWCMEDTTGPVISDAGVVVSGVRTSGCLNEQLSISWRRNQVQQRRGGGGSLLVEAIWVIILYSANSAELLHKKKSEAEI